MKENTKTAREKPEKKYAYSDITGQTFGMLTAISTTEKRDKSGYRIWLCRCACGETLEISYNKLLYTSVKSCGCQKKLHNQKLQTYLTHVAGTSVDMLKSKKVPSDNTTGYKGVYYIRGKYVAKIVFQKKQYLLGSYDNIEDAAEARREAEKVLFDGVSDHYRRWKLRAETDPEWSERNPIQVIVNQENKRLQVTLLPEIS